MNALLYWEYKVQFAETRKFALCGDVKMIKFEIVKKYIDEYDYYGLLAGGAPNDEFDSYSRKLAAVITENDTVEEIAVLIAETIDKAFNEEIKLDNFLEIAQKIRNAL